MDHIEKLSPLPDDVRESRAAAGKVLRQVREELGFNQQSVGPLSVRSWAIPLLAASKGTTASPGRSLTRRRLIRSGSSAGAGTPAAIGRS